MWRKVVIISALCGGVWVASQPACAVLPVIDVRAIAQMLQQIQTLQQQLATARNKLQQAQSAFAAMTGPRGMEQLLANEVRNYLPPDWAQVANAVDAARGQYAALSNELQQLMARNAVLNAGELANLGPQDRQRIADQRRDVALSQGMAREALAAASSRFASLRSLIDAIPNAEDPKAVMDLQARIAAEQAMLANEHTKLTMLFEASAAERAAGEQQQRERALRDLGSLRTLRPMGLAAPL